MSTDHGLYLFKAAATETEVTGSRHWQLAEPAHVIDLPSGLTCAAVDDTFAVKQVNGFFPGRGLAFRCPVFPREKTAI